MSADSAHEQVETLEKRVEELQATLSAVRDDLSSLRGAALYTYGAPVELYKDAEQGANSAAYSAALEKISGALGEAFGSSTSGAPS